MVQTFVFFTDRLGAAKIRTVKSEKTCDIIHAIDQHGCGTSLHGEGIKIKTMKISSKGLTCIFHEILQ